MRKAWDWIRERAVDTWGWVLDFLEEFGGSIVAMLVVLGVCVGLVAWGVSASSSGITADETRERMAECLAARGVERCECLDGVWAASGHFEKEIGTTRVECWRSLALDAAEEKRP